MGMRVATNIAAINAQRNLNGSQMNISDSLAKLASGSRINKAADDAAGLAISEKLKAKGIWLTAIRPPTVPRGESRLRVTICASHNANDIKYLSYNLNEIFS